MLYPKTGRRRFARRALYLFGAIPIAATLLPLLPLPLWWVRVFDFPRAQIAALLAVALIAAVPLLRPRSGAVWALVALLVYCLGDQLLRIYPYTPLARPQVERYRGDDADARLRLMVANVRMDNRNADGLLALVRDERPDLLLAVETDRWWIERLAPLRERLAHVVLHPLDNTYGIALYSRFELIDARVEFLIEDDVPSIHARIALPAGVDVALHALHPRPPTPNEASTSTDRDGELLLVGKHVRDAAHPVIVAGDLNDVAWSATTKRFQRISRLRDPRIGRGLYPTFHAGYPLLRWPLDHVFFSDRLRLIEMRRLAYFGSDHFPISVTLAYTPPERRDGSDPPPADSDDMQEANETIRDAKQDE